MDNSNLPPVLPPVEVAVPGSMEVPTPITGKAPEWPVKKKKKWLPLLGGLLAIVLVLGASFGAFYFTKNLNQAAVPTAPTSEPEASAGKNLGKGAKNSIDLDGKNCKQGCGSNEYCDNGRCRSVGGKADERTDMEIFRAGQDVKQVEQARLETLTNNASNNVNTVNNTCAAVAPTGLTVTNISPTSVRLTWTPGVGPFVKLWVSKAADPTADCLRLANKTTDANCPVNENGLPNWDADIPSTPAQYTVTGLTPNTVYYWRLQSWISSGCDRAAATINFTTQPAVTAPVCADLKTQTVAKTTLTPGEKTTVTCDFGKVADCIAPSFGVSGSWSNCTFKSVTGTNYSFECTSPTAAGTFNSKCSLFKTATCTADAAVCSTQPVSVTVASACTTTAPTSPSVQKISPTSVKLKWNPGTSATTNIRLYVSKFSAPVSNCNGVEGNGVASDCFLKKLDIAAGTTEYTLTGLTPNTKYYWRVLNYSSDSCNIPLATVETFTTDEVAAGDPSLSMEKRIYKNETSNKAGSYDLKDEIDTVSKDQTIVVSLEVTNDGSGKAEGIVVKDILKEDNRELLTFIDSDSRCTYATSTRTVTCSGMSLDPDKSDKYVFRVKVSGSAVNGDTILNNALLSYTGMPTGGETEAEVELMISTVVGCDNTCTTDEECGTGLSCDPDTSKCRKPACADESNCICTSAAAPTRSATRTATRVAQPTVLPETGILDFPGVAAFGGGLLLAIVGILLAL